MSNSLIARILTLLLGTGVCVALLSASVTQEIGHGSLHVTVTMAENGRRLPKASVSLTYRALESNVEERAESTSGVELQPMHRDRRQFREYTTDKNGEITIDHLETGVYLIQADGSAHSMKHQVVYVDEGKTNTSNLKLQPREPYLELYASQRVFTPDEKPSFQISGFDIVNKVQTRYFKLDLAAIAAKGGLSRLLYSFSRPGNEGGSDPSKSAVSSAEIEQPILSKDIEGAYTDWITMPKMDEGFYYVVCTVGQKSRATYLNVSRIGLVTKTSGKDALCYVADLVSGKPVAGAAIQAPAAGGFQRIATTDRSGTARVSVPSGSDKKALLVASSGKSQGIVDFDNESNTDADTSRIFVYADRPIYRPGDTVHFKGIVRNLNGLAYRLPSGGSAKVAIRDTDDIEVNEFSMPLSSKGTFSGSFTSNVEDKPGVYSINVTYAGAEFTYYANLAAYRKPEFSIKVTPDKKFFVYGERASATVKAEYYFGGPVVGAKVQAYVTRSPDYGYGDESAESDYSDEETDSGGDPSSGYYEKEFQGEYDEQVEAVTNEKGEAVIEFDSKTQGDPDRPDYDLTYSVSATITDASNKYFNATGEVSVVRGDVKVAIDSGRYVAEPGDVVDVAVKVQRQQDDGPVSGKDVALQIGTEKWDGNKSTYVVLHTLSGKTDSKGVAHIPVKVGDEGSLVFKTEVPDSQNRQVKAVEYLYVEGDRLFGPSAAKFSLTLDKRSYQVGDRCRVLIETDKPGGSAVVTIQAEKVFASYVVELRKPATSISIPVTHDYAPNVWVSAVAVRNKHLLEAQARLNVNLTEHELKIKVTPDKPDYQPGEVARLTIRTTDGNDKPVPADLSLGVVDESIYAIKEDSTNIKRGFYPMRANRVRTNFSFEEIYLDGGDKAGGNIPVRTKFLDTADWQPSVSTDSSGIARTQVKLPDNLTSWRATVIGVSDATQVGMSRVNFRARKPLSVRLELPSFLVVQDTQQVKAIITNDTGADRDVTVRLDAQGVDIGGDTATKITVPASKPQTLVWDVKTPKSGLAKLTVYAMAGSGIGDAEERSIEVKPHGRLLVENHSGEIQGNTSVQFNLSNQADRNTGRLLLTVSPSIGSSIYQSLDELIGFPYGCTEQTMSRFLPAVVLSSTMKKMNVRSDLQAKVPSIVATGYARLAKMQHGDGSWGWWEYDEADDFMTAYVLDGAHRAKAAGYPPDKIDLHRALSWALQRLKTAPTTGEHARDTLYLCYAVALYGYHKEVGEAINRVVPKCSSDFALLAMTDDLVGDHEGSQNALANLRAMAKVQGDIATFPASRWEYGSESVDLPLLAFVHLASKDPVIPKLVRYLNASRLGDMWFSTRDSSFALLALTEYLDSTRDLGIASDIDITVNGGKSRHIHFDPASQFSAATKIEVPIAELTPGPNRIDFHRTGGEAACYYSGNLQQIELMDRLLPVSGSGGLTISRNYYLLLPQRMDDGRLELRPTRTAIESARSGDIIRVELMITSQQPREFIMIEDPIPSGCRITEREYVDSGEQWSNWWSQTIVRDDRAAFFMRELPAGVQKLTYTIRAEQLGVGHALPPQLSNMYDAGQSASGGENLLEIGP